MTEKQLDLVNYLDRIASEASAQDNYLDDRGRERPDPTPVAPPVGYKQQPSLVEMIRNMVRSEKLAQEAAAAGMETFEESEDFDVDDEMDPSSPWENEYDPPLKDIRKAVEEERKAKATREGGAGGKPPSAGPKAPEGPSPAAPPPPAKPA